MPPWPVPDALNLPAGAALMASASSLTVLYGESDLHLDAGRILVHQRERRVARRRELGQALPVHHGDLDRDHADACSRPAAAVAIAEWPTTPEPPVRLTTLNGWPRSFSSSAATMRAVASVPPPAPQGTTTVTGRLG